VVVQLWAEVFAALVIGTKHIRKAAVFLFLFQRLKPNGVEDGC
jgi:hypothetical protein